MPVKFNLEDLTRRMHLLCNQSFSGNWAALHRATGIPHATLHGYKEGKEPSLDSLTRIANACDASLDWFITGEEPMKNQVALPSSVDRSPAHISDEELETEHPGEYVMVPRYDVSASAGYGSFIDGENIIDKMAFRRNWLRQDMGLQIEHVVVIDVMGDSMQPTLQPGDQILVDLRTQTSMAANAIYVIQVGGALLVKRLQRMISGAISVVSDNQLYKPELVPPGEQDQLHVVGRVVWAGKRM
ncbi:MAG: helix-turn-helix transcriptional regulator [Magnetococcus sp. YQC-5]